MKTAADQHQVRARANFQRRLTPRHLQRSTPYGGGVDVRLSSALEICLLDRVTGFDRLIRIIEDVPLAHVLRSED